MVSLNFVLLLCTAICFAALVVREVVAGARAGGSAYGALLPLGLLLWELPALLAVWP